MNSDADFPALTELFAEDARRAPTAAPVAANVHRTLRRRQVRARVAAVGGAGVVAAGAIIGVRAALPAQHAATIEVAGQPTAATLPVVPPTTPASASPSPSPKKSVSPVPSDQPDTPNYAVDRLFNHYGVSYDEALHLNTLWGGSQDDPYPAKAVAGQLLDDGKPLPSVSSPVLADDRAKFAAAGYTASDAQTLADLWNAGDTDTAEAFAGQLLLDGHALPIKP